MARTRSKRCKDCGQYVLMLRVVNLARTRIAVDDTPVARKAMRDDAAWRSDMEGVTGHYKTCKALSLINK